LITIKKTKESAAYNETRPFFLQLNKKTEGKYSFNSIDSVIVQSALTQNHTIGEMSDYSLVTQRALRFHHPEDAMLAKWRNRKG
tara:strand:+ start:169 stop:420 length:252 start_codon:yes stop_codon:yes gene_type:complete